MNHDLIDWSRCYVCCQPINVQPQPKLPVDPDWAFKELKEGRKPDKCISCGASYRFKLERNRKAFCLYLRFLSMHLPEGASDELWNMIDM